MTRSLFAPVRGLLALMTGSCLVLTACQWPGTGRIDETGRAPSSATARAPGASPTSATAGSNSASTSTVNQAAGPPSLSGGATAATRATAGADPSSNPSAVVSSSASSRQPASSGPNPNPAPTRAPAPAANPGVPAQAGDPNDAFGGGGAVRCPVFPADNWWNRDIRNLPVHPQSGAWVASMGNGKLHSDFGTVWEGNAIGIPYIVVDGSQPRVPVEFGYADESDPGPYPIPPGAPIEDGSDHHVLIIDDTNCRLYELFDATPIDNGSRWRAGSGAVYDLRSNNLRPTGWTSADAAGLPIFAGLATYQEVVVERKIDHALRFTASRTQKAYIRPATHFASSITDPGVPPMGARFRLRADFDCSPFSAEIQVACTALKTYGMFLADNGSNWMVSGAPDPRWNDQALADLGRIPGSAFEAVDTGEPITR